MLDVLIPQEESCAGRRAGNETPQGPSAEPGASAPGQVQAFAAAPGASVPSGSLRLPKGRALSVPGVSPLSSLHHF